MKHSEKWTLCRLARMEGFSLVEVTIAIGIMAFGLVAVFGLMPVGLDSFRDAEKETVVQQIEDRLATEIKQTNFDEFTKIYGLKSANWGMPRYWDVEGNPVKWGDSRVVYRSICRTMSEVDGVEGMNAKTAFKLPNGASNPDVRVVLIEIWRFPENVGNPTNYFTPEFARVKERGDYFRSVSIIGNGVNTAAVQVN